jgi:hypothetical protein
LRVKGKKLVSIHHNFWLTSALPDKELLATDNQPDYKTDTGYFPAGDLPEAKPSAPAVSSERARVNISYA